MARSSAVFNYRKIHNDFELRAVAEIVAAMVIVVFLRACINEGDVPEPAGYIFKFVF
jgi:hypothetical protein